MNSIICHGYCVIEGYFDLDAPPLQVSFFDGTWNDAVKVGWRTTQDERFSRTGEFVHLCPRCVLKDRILKGTRNSAPIAFYISAPEIKVQFNSETLEEWSKKNSLVYQYDPATDEYLFAYSPSLGMINAAKGFLKGFEQGFNEGYGSTPSPRQVITNILKRDRTTDEILEWMQRQGISLVLNWGEDNNLWECDFINGRGKRFSSVEPTVRKAIRECIKKMAQVELGMEPVQFKSLEDY